MCATVFTATVCGMGPPSSGGVAVAQILSLMENTRSAGVTDWHLFAEASRLTYADRARYLADADQVKVPVRGLIDADYLRSRARLIDPGAAAKGWAEAGDPPWREGRRHAPDLQEDLPGTTHLSVIDANGLAISVTASIETAFGSGRVAGGFLLNNQLTDFSFRPTAEDGRPIANAPAAGKRPRSSMAPTIVTMADGGLILTGSPGGSRIPEYVAQNVFLMLERRLDPAAAAAFPHLSHRNRDVLVVEPAWPNPDALSDLGHVLETQPMTSGVHTILREPGGRLLGGADPRREGVAVGR